MISIGPAGTFQSPTLSRKDRTMTSFFSIEQIKKYNTSKGFYFFQPETMRFFRSRVGVCTYPAADGSGTYFVTSEQFDSHSPRLYTVRKIVEDGSIDQVGEFQQHRHLSTAKAAAKKAAQG